MRTYLTFGDLEGKLDMLPVECSRYQRKGRYSVAKLIEKYGRQGNMMKWKEQLNGDCPKRDARAARPLRSHLPRSAKCCDVAKEVLWKPAPPAPPEGPGAMPTPSLTE